MKAHFFIFILLFNFSLYAFSQDSFEKREFIHKGDTLKYQISYPDNFDKTKKYPIVLFLHGAGERGNDNTLQMTHGSFLFTDSTNRADFPSIVIFPQCPKNRYWIDVVRTADNGFVFREKPKITKELFLVKKLIDAEVKSGAVDKKKMYVMGLSMGGMATYDLICRYPKTFAAAIPICGAVNTKRLKKVKNMPIRIFHGNVDNIVPVSNSRDAYIELKANGSINVEYIEFPGVGHDSWTKAFAYPDFIQWLYSQSK